MNSKTSLSAIAVSVCSLIARCRPWSALGSNPPVSTARKVIGPMCPSPYCRSRVRPGKSATSAAREWVRRLNSVDLPTLVRPTRATAGFMASPSALWHQQRQRAMLGLDQQSARKTLGLRDDRTAIELDPPHQLAVAGAEQMHIASIIADRDPFAHAARRGDAAVREQLVGPLAGAAGQSERMDRRSRIDPEQLRVHDRDPGAGRHLARPLLIAAVRVETRDPALIGGRTDAVA